MLEGVEILIAEDNEINYTLLNEMMNPTRVVIHWAKNGSEALDLLTKNENISLILMDINMPVMDGITATRKIREKKINIPIIFQTAYDSKENKENCIAAGGNEYLNKPIQWDKLYMVLKKYLLTSQV